jgi:hypothetical protein
LCGVRRFQVKLCRTAGSNRSSRRRNGLVVGIQYIQNRGKILEGAVGKARDARHVRLQAGSLNERHHIDRGVLLVAAMVVGLEK